VKAATDVWRYHWHIATSTLLLVLAGLIIGAMALLADLIVRSRGDT
jgi:hypothetical protein